jgi:hypothetical protein
MEPRRFFLSRLAGLPLLAMAAADGVQAHSDLCLWRLLPGSWRNRGRSQQLRSKVRKSHNLCFSGGVGRQSDYRIVARSRAISPGPEWAKAASLCWTCPRWAKS